MYNYIFHPGLQNLFLPLSYQSLLFLMITGFKVPFLTGLFQAKFGAGFSGFVWKSSPKSHRFIINSPMNHWIKLNKDVPIISHQSTLKHTKTYLKCLLIRKFGSRWICLHDVTEVTEVATASLQCSVGLAFRTYRMGSNPPGLREQHWTTEICAILYTI